MPSARRQRDAPRKGDLREQAILDTAEELLRTEGLDTMTVEGIARGAGISRAALYFYFGSKNEVLTALVARTMRGIARDAAGAATSTEPPFDVAAAEVAHTADRWRRHEVVMRTAAELGPIVPGIGVLWRETVDGYVEAMRATLARAGFPDDESPSGAACFARNLCGMTEHAFVLESATAAREGRRSDFGNCRDGVTAVWRRVLGRDGVRVGGS